MKVSELIAELQKCPQDAKVCIPASDQELSKWDSEVRDVIINNDNTVDLDNWPAENF
jgi:hypothetical protein